MRLLPSSSCLSVERGKNVKGKECQMPYNVPQVGGQAIQTDRLEAVPLAPCDTGGLGTAMTRDLISHRRQYSKTAQSNLRKLGGGMNQRCNLKE
jgi:hypothetical protein